MGGGAQGATARNVATDPLSHLPRRVVLFDGVCVVCNRSVEWLLGRDRAHALAFAPLQGETARRIAEALPGRIPQDLDTVVLVEREDGGARVHLRSQALRRALELTGGGLLARLLGWVPRPLADLLYRGFARVRYRLFGRRESCRVPTPEERPRLLP